ncbi:MAG: hypothetical protein KGI35_19010, partial [Burkholderiales bacterium]|nr:hypothetical protein [Burkholderiales bacterium]
GGEHVGLFGANYLFEMAPGWAAGPALYGAVTGQRGGLFTWGAEVQRRWALTERWRGVAGLYVGGGGGAAAPVGGGLMLRPHADLLFGFGGWGGGVSISQVRFPSGDIHGTQIGLVFMRDGGFAYTAPGARGRSLDFSGSGGLGTDRADLVVGHYFRASGSANSLSTVGMRLEHEWSPVLATTFEADGAASGGADGYAEATVGAQALWPVVGDWLRLGARAAVGMAGGGAVATGGGLIGKAALATRLQWGRNLTLGLEAGKLRAFNGRLRADYVQASLGFALDAPAPCELGACRRVHEMEWGLGVQEYAHAQRKNGAVESMSAIGLEFNRWLDDHFYLAGKAYSAITGGAGAYSIGLVGPGAAWRGSHGLSLGAEALVGAAGGGGVASTGGAVTQPMLWGGYELGRYNRLRLSAGYLKSLRGALATPVVGLTWIVEFGVP